MNELNNFMDSNKIDEEAFKIFYETIDSMLKEKLEYAISIMLSVAEISPNQTKEEIIHLGSSLLSNYIKLHCELIMKFKEGGILDRI